MKISAVVENNLCVSCGICAGVCPQKCIESHYNKGSYLPKIDDSKCINCGICYKLCPGKFSDYLNLYKITKKNLPQNIFFGNFKKCLTAQTKNKNILEFSGSGGIVTTLIMKLLKDGDYKFAFLVDTYNHDEEIFSKKYSAEMNFINTPRSRYLTVNHKNAVSYIIKNPHEKIILVGTSCFIQGVQNVIEHFNLNRENYLLLGLFCDKTMNYHVWNHFKIICGNKNPLKNLYFRHKAAGGYPGNVLLECTNKTFALPRQIRMQMKDFFCLERCLYCLDKLNQFADISFGDNYTNVQPSNAEKGSSNIIIRTERGLKIFNQYNDNFNFFEINPKEIATSQNLSLRQSNYIFGIYKSAQIGYSINVVPDKDICLIYETAETKQLYESLMTKLKIGKEENFPAVGAEIWKLIIPQLQQLNI